MWTFPSSLKVEVRQINTLSASSDKRSFKSIPLEILLTFPLFFQLLTAYFGLI